MVSEYIFTSTDPLNREVVLPKRVMEGSGHIAERHVEMKARVRDIRRAVRDPDIIAMSTLRPDRDIYIRMGGVLGYLALGTKVIVQFSSPSRGTIVSAWLVREPSEADLSGGIRYEKRRGR